MKYTIIRSGDASWVVDKVNEFIAKGWEPQGGISVGMAIGKDRYGHRLEQKKFAQAMIKKSDNEDK